MAAYNTPFIKGTSPEFRGTSVSLHLEKVIKDWPVNPPHTAVLLKLYMDFPMVRILCHPLDIGEKRHFLWMVPTYYLVAPDRLGRGLLDPELESRIRTIGYFLGKVPLPDMLTSVIYSPDKPFENYSDAVRGLLDGGVKLDKRTSIPLSSGSDYAPAVGETDGSLIAEPNVPTAAETEESPVANSEESPVANSEESPVANSDDVPSTRQSAPIRKRSIDTVVRKRRQPLVQPSGSVAQPSDSVAQPSDSVAQPSDSVAQPSGSVAQPSDSVAQPSDIVVEICQTPAKAEDMLPDILPEAGDEEAIDSVQKFILTQATVYEVAKCFRVDPKFLRDYVSIDEDPLLMLAARANMVDGVQLLLRLFPALIGMHDTSHRGLLQYITELKEPERICRAIIKVLSSSAFWSQVDVGSNDPGSGQVAHGVLQALLHDILLYEGAGVDLLLRQGLRARSLFSMMKSSNMKADIARLGLDLHTAWRKVEAFCAHRRL